MINQAVQIGLSQRPKNLVAPKEQHEQRNAEPF